MKINKTNAARLLDKAKITYELIPYEVDEKDLSAVHVAASLGENIEQVFKTLVLHGDKSGYFVCVIPGEHEVDLKLAAKASGNKKCDLIPMKELLPLTGYIRVTDDMVKIPLLSPLKAVLRISGIVQSLLCHHCILGCMDISDKNPLQNVHLSTECY